MERQADGAVVLRPLPADAHAAWLARLDQVLGRFEGMPDEMERDKTPPRDIGFD